MRTWCSTNVANVAMCGGCSLKRYTFFSATFKHSMLRIFGFLSWLFAKTTKRSKRDGGCNDGGDDDCGSDGSDDAIDATIDGDVNGSGDDGTLLNVSFLKHCCWPTTVTTATALAAAVLPNNQPATMAMCQYQRQPMFCVSTRVTPSGWFGRRHL